MFQFALESIAWTEWTIWFILSTYSSCGALIPHVYKSSTGTWERISSWHTMNIWHFYIQHWKELTLLVMKECKTSSATVKVFVMLHYSHASYQSALISRETRGKWRIVGSKPFHQIQELLQDKCNEAGHRGIELCCGQCCVYGTSIEEISLDFCKRYKTNS